jgi:hypothetical protein
MSLATAELPADPAALRVFALACQGELKAAQTAVQLKALEIEKLRFQIAKLRRMQFGRSSERITRQIELPEHLPCQEVLHYRSCPTNPTSTNRLATCSWRSRI